MNPGKVFREEGDRREAAKVFATQRAPRSWDLLVVAWVALVHKLAAIVGAPPGELDGNWLAARDGRAVALTTWRWMWSLPPCSEARKAAFMLGAAALLIGRWRLASQDAVASVVAGVNGIAIGQRAESLLRIAAWHIDDARGEAHGRTLGIEPMIPPHERAYTAGQDIDPDRGGINFVTLAGRDRLDVARRTLADHPWRRPIPRYAVEFSFADLCGASLPDGPWVMTSRDVERFLDLILEDAGDGITRVHVAEPDSRGTIAAPEMLFADPPQEDA